MSTVWVLIVVAYTGHMVHMVANVIPTLEFSTQERWLAAIHAFKEDAKDKAGTINMRCLKITK